MQEQMMLQRVLSVFDRVQRHEVYMPVIMEVEDLVKELRTDDEEFMTCFQQGYLKVCKKLKNSGIRVPEIFVNLIKTMQELLSKLMILKDPETKIQEGGIIKFNDFQLKLFSQLTMSTVLLIRIFGAQLLFTLLKCIRPPLSQNKYQGDILELVIASILNLMKERNKSLKRYGLKLSSLVQQLESISISKHASFLRNQILNVIKRDEDQQTREVAFTNLLLNRGFLDEFLLRLRDRNPKIRATVFKKLTGARMLMDQVGLANTYKILYDGMSCGESNVKQQCTSYFFQSFGKFIPGFGGIQTQENNHFHHFLEFFQPNLLIQNPILLRYLREVLTRFFLYKSADQHLSKYLKSVCQKMIATKHCTNEIFYIGVLAEASSSTYYKVVEEFLQGALIAQMIRNAYSQKQYFQVMQLVRLVPISGQIDEFGREKIAQSLVFILQSPASRELPPSNRLQKDTDVCWIKDSTQIERQRLTTNEYEQRGVYSAIDIVPSVVKLLIALRPEGVENILQETVNNLIEQEVNYKKEVQVAAVSVVKLQQQGNLELIQNFRAKVVENQAKQTFVRQKYGWIAHYFYICTPEKSNHLFKSVYKPDSQTHKPFSNLLLASYALNNSTDSMKVFQTLWENCVDAGQSSLQALVCIRGMADLVMKYNLLKTVVETTTFSPDMFTVTLCRLIFSQNLQTRLLSIQHMCRLLYNNKIREPTMCFVYLIFLWFDTNSKPKSIHLISIFIRQYILKSASNMNEISDYLQLFVVSLNKLHLGKKTINKQIVNYPIRFSEFIRKVIVISMKVLKYKSSTGTVRDLPKDEKAFGPQESFVLALLHQKDMQKYADTVFGVCDFVNNTTLEQLLVIRQVVMGNKDTYLLMATRNFIDQIDRTINAKGVANDHLLQLLKGVLLTNRTQIKNEVNDVIRNIIDLELVLSTQNNSEPNWKPNQDSEQEQIYPEHSENSHHLNIRAPLGQVVQEGQSAERYVSRRQPT